MHPYLRAGWNRPAVYSKMGFDETMFLEDMTNVGYYRQYPSDSYNFDLIKQRFENKEDGEKLFLFDITIKYEAGISLAGTEVKSLRMGKGSIKESFIRIENGEIILYGMHITCLLYTSSFRWWSSQPYRASLRTS